MSSFVTNGFPVARQITDSASVRAVCEPLVIDVGGRWCAGHLTGFTNYHMSQGQRQIG